MANFVGIEEAGYGCRDTCEVVEAPTAGNDFKLVVEFNDDPLPGSSWYEINVVTMPTGTYTPTPTETLTPTPTSTPTSGPTVIATIRVGSGGRSPHGVAVNPNTNRIYVTNLAATTSPSSTAPATRSSPP